MINFSNFNKACEIDNTLPMTLLTLIKSEIKFETSQGLKGISEDDLKNISNFRNIVKRYNIFTTLHPILEDDLNLQAELETILGVA